jgi:hypothetical protein
MNRECIEQYFGEKGIDKIEESIINPNTILYSGVDPAHINIPLDPTRFKFFTTNYQVAQAFASTKKSGRVQKYIVTEPLKIYVQSDPDVLYFNTPLGYSSKEAQCLIHDGYHGYATRMQSGEIEDIGLADISGIVKVVSGGRKQRLTRRVKRAPSRKVYRARSNTARLPHD